MASALHLTKAWAAPRSHSPGPALATALSSRRAPRAAVFGGALHPGAAAQEAAGNGERGPGEGGHGGMLSTLW